MPRDKSLSHEKIIRAAMDEFSEFGYDKASMRRIGQRCGLTAAALYRHFDSKEAMFEALVEPAVTDMKKWLEAHAAADIKGGADPEMMWNSVEVDMMRELIYPRMDEFSMIINKAKGSKYEDFLNELVTDHQERLMPHLRMLRDAGYKVRDISEDELHMLITAYCSALFEPVAHGYSLENALKYLSTVEEFFMPGWKNLMGFSSGN
ncbi:MAG: TetR/AcrR family transcriptional regulator [Mogibacterium sp.]|nr:TetR/AcrR family transcriptional regulator [Mogibacterium sp.]